MKNLLYLFMVLMLFGLLVGCGGDGGTNGGNGDDEYIQANLVASLTAAAPSMTNIDDPVWATIDSTPVRVGFDDAYGVNPNLVDDTLMMWAIRTNDMIYLRARWKDFTADLKGTHIRKSGFVGGWEYINTADAGGGEDAFFIVFDGLDNDSDTIPERADCATMCHAAQNMMATTGGGHVDAWAWKSATSNPAYLSIDQWWSATGNFNDPDPLNPRQPYIDNWNSSLVIPRWMHTDDTAYTGLYLYIDDTVRYQYVGYGWDEKIGYIMPGHIIDTTVYKDAIPQSRWNVRTIASYDSTSAPYGWTAVFARLLNTSYSDDVNLTGLDSIQVTVAVTNHHTDITDDTWREHSGSYPFYIVFNRSTQ